VAIGLHSPVSMCHLAFVTPLAVFRFPVPPADF
jgi:hypothetical protein